jgi:excisionase family DNA binding protein
MEGIASTLSDKEAIQLHVRCFHLWDGERRARHLAIRRSSSRDAGREVAQRLGVPAPYVYELARRREIPTCRFGRYVRIPAREPRQWIQQRRVDIGPRAVRQFARAKAR